jgi:hypothetical protein
MLAVGLGLALVGGIIVNSVHWLTGTPLALVGIVGGLWALGTAIYLCRRDKQAEGWAGTWPLLLAIAAGLWLIASSVAAIPLTDTSIRLWGGSGSAGVPVLHGALRSDDSTRNRVLEIVGGAPEYGGVEFSHPANLSLGRALMNDPDPRMVRIGLVYLSRSGPEAKGALPELRALLPDANPDDTVRIARVVRHIGPEAKDFAPSLRKVLSASEKLKLSPSDRAALAAGLWKIDRADSGKEALAAIRQALSDAKDIDRYIVVASARVFLPEAEADLRAWLKK